MPAFICSVENEEWLQAIGKDCRQGHEKRQVEMPSGLMRKATEPSRHIKLAGQSLLSALY